mgnify:CR=1 FL=1
MRINLIKKKSWKKLSFVQVNAIRFVLLRLAILLCGLILKPTK